MLTFVLAEDWRQDGAHRVVARNLVEDVVPASAIAPDAGDSLVHGDAPLCTVGHR